MAKVKGLDKFQRTIAAAKYAAQEMREELNKYQEWYEAKSDWYKFTKNGQAWAKHLYEVHQLVEAIENIEFIEKKFNIRFGEVVLPIPKRETRGKIPKHLLHEDK